MPNYQIKLNDFEGPLELLLTLINNKKLDISEISLSQITNEYLDYIDKNAASTETLNSNEEYRRELALDDIADFLIIASKLIYMKSKLILPEMFNVEDEDDDSLELKKQLKIYREYYEARKKIENIIKEKKFSYSRHTKLIQIRKKFIPPSNINSKKLEKIFKNFLNSQEKIQKLPQKNIDKVINIKEKIKYIFDLIKNKTEFVFDECIKDQKNKTEIIISFLALLELSKQGSLIIKQEYLFNKITINSK